ncbi:ADP-ribosylation factor, putative [Entamoeba invadens IP1]|uniref:ADP-ribosylation factor, putative n=1 Tax=Entamoeba invadens IP1 TaxID=370355 RepID=A0A0A1TWP5_ENTIV|nr:ADP-ribosylation factor, putative [Entamoeba invadens IP1]ELP85596.1 ADP-ribosylation factor, putative [Entamoeba invadens IP1]|eukprot:XP_004184942.1 ADP-ribosylation factor, putative [Entamoeba invadens IP1]
MISLTRELLSLCKKTPDPSLNIMIVGLDGSGKTYFEEYVSSILNKVPLQEIYEMSTIGVNAKTVHYGGFQISLWDIGGTSSFRSVWNRYIDESNVIIYCIDSSDPTRLDESFSALNYHKSFCSFCPHKDGQTKLTNGATSNRIANAQNYPTSIHTFQSTPQPSLSLTSKNFLTGASKTLFNFCFTF